VQYGIRPSDLEIADAGVPARVVVVEPTGAETELLVDVGGQPLVVVMHGRTPAQPDETIHLALDAAKAHVFDAVTGVRLS
jgi:multiple sugar transport system ATP-binding protein